MTRQLSKKELGKELKQFGLDTTVNFIGLYFALPALLLKTGIGLSKVLENSFIEKNEEIISGLGKKKINFLLHNNERTANLFIKIYSNYILETVAEKRKIYLNFLSDIADGERVSEELDNKFITAINSLSNAELLVLERITRNYSKIIGATKDKNVAKTAGIHTEDIVKSKILSDINKLSDEHLNSEIEKMLFRFGSLGLINVKTGRTNGTFYSLNDDGNLFIKLISGK